MSSATITATSAGEDAVRLGGDEFAVLMRHATPLELTRLVNRIKLSLAASVTDAEHPPITVSIGVGHHEPGQSLELLLAAADGQMYAEKLRRSPLPDRSYPVSKRRQPTLDRGPERLSYGTLWAAALCASRHPAWCGFGARSGCRRKAISPMGCTMNGRRRPRWRPNAGPLA